MRWFTHDNKDFGLMGTPIVGVRKESLLSRKAELKSPRAFHKSEKCRARMVELSVDSIQYCISRNTEAIVKSCDDSVTALLPGNSVAVSGNEFGCII
jgi:hypothetical protein